MPAVSPSVVLRHLAIGQVPVGPEEGQETEEHIQWTGFDVSTLEGAVQPTLCREGLHGKRCIWS